MLIRFADNGFNSKFICAPVCESDLPSENVINGWLSFDFILLSALIDSHGPKHW